jgi:hypothetical protein
MNNTANNEEERITTLSSDVLENDIRTSMPRILEILLLDRTASTSNTSKNIIWTNDNYAKYDPTAYAATAQIRPELITGDRGSLIRPRALKTKELQKERTLAYVKDHPEGEFLWNAKPRFGKTLTNGLFLRGSNS